MKIIKQLITYVPSLYSLHGVALSIFITWSCPLYFPLYTRKSNSDCDSRI